MIRHAQAKTEDIRSLDCELYVYRKGCLSVNLNFVQHTMIWRESRQWCNNFVRTLTDDQVRKLRGLILSSGILDHPDSTAGAGGDAGLSDRRSLKLNMNLTERQIEMAVDDNNLPGWVILRQEIEKLSHVLFEL